MKTKDYPVGTIVPYQTKGGEKLQVVASKDNEASCEGCYFNDYQQRIRGFSKFSCCEHKMACTPPYRKDKKHIIFWAL